MAYEIFPLATIALIIFVNAYATTFLFSFVGFMVVDLGAASNKNEAGYVAGCITSAFFFGGMVSSIFWGFIADKYGRKPVLLIALFSIFFFSLLFGFSRNVYMALAIRFLAGSFNGIVAVCKTMIPDFTSGEHVGMGMSLISGLWSLGLIMGPAVSGWTSSIPADAFDRVENQTKQVTTEEVNNPYILPCIISSGLGLLGFLVTALFLPETLGRDKCIRQQGYTRVDSEGPGNNDGKELFEVTELTQSSETESIHEQELNGVEQNNSGVLNKDFIICLLAYCVLCFAQIFIDDVIPLWALADMESGGLNFGSQEVGSLLASGGAFMLFSSILVYPLVSKMISCTTIMIVFSTLSGTLAIIEPMIVHEIENKNAIFIAVVIINGIRVSMTMFVFNANFVLTNNTISPEFRGRANGISMGVASLFKAFGPASGGLVFAWSIQRGERGQLLHNSPFDWHFTFLLDGFLFFFCGAIVFIFVPRELNYNETTIETTKSSELSNEKPALVTNNCA